MTCPECRNPRQESDFYVVRDGVRLRTRPCKHCIASANVKHNREQKKRLA